MNENSPHKDIALLENAVDFSIVIPVYYNEGELFETFRTIKEEVLDENPDLSAEVIFVDDGSGDRSFEELRELYEKNRDLVRVVKFTRNFGQYNAKFAGHRIARGKCIISLSADMQDPPRLINEMIRYHFKENYPIVICVREKRKDTFIKELTSKLFYSMIQKLSFEKMPVGGFDYHLMSSAVRDTIFTRPEKNSYFQGQIFWSGYRIKSIPYERMSRKVGTSRWTFKKRIKTLIDAVLCYSYFPLRMMSVMGATIAMAGFAYAGFIVVTRLLGNYPFVGWAPLMIVILLLSGIQMLMLGIIGEYLWRTLDQVRGRDSFVVEQVLDDAAKTRKKSDQ